MRIDDAGNSVAEEHVLISNRVAADDAAFRLIHFERPPRMISSRMQGRLSREIRRWTARKQGGRPWRTHRSVHSLRRFLQRGADHPRWA